MNLTAALVAFVVKLATAATILLLPLAQAVQATLVEAPRVPLPGETMEIAVTPDCEWRTFEDASEGWDCPWMHADR